MPERLKGICVPAFARPDDPPGRVIDYHGDVPVILSLGWWDDLSIGKTGTGEDRYQVSFV